MNKVVHPANLDGECFTKLREASVPKPFGFLYACAVQKQINSAMLGDNRLKYLFEFSLVGNVSHDVLDSPAK